MPEQPEEQPPKLIVDEDWKEQVQREKAHAAASTSPLEGEPIVKPDGQDELATGNQSADQPTGEAMDAAMQMPPPTFDFLISMLATQALHAMGQLPGPEGDLAKPEKPIAKHYIDLLGVIEAKTSGNLEAQESKMLTEVLHQLRLAYLQV
ncbi:DUF1844 domain-containing protein [Planctomycetaceae bacterium SH139]